MQPIPCDGRFLMALSHSGQPSQLFEVDWSSEMPNAEFHALSGSEGEVLLNAIGYRSTDHLIYGIHPGEHVLFQIDAAGRTHNLGKLNLNPQMRYYDGDISPDGKQLVLLGAHGVPPFSHPIAVVDLTHPEHTVREQMLRYDTSIDFNYCADIAFHPKTAKLYGFDGFNRQLVTIDPVLGKVDVVNGGAGRLFRGLCSIESMW